MHCFEKISGGGRTLEKSWSEVVEGGEQCVAVSYRWAKWSASFKGEKKKIKHLYGFVLTWKQICLYSIFN